MKNNVVIENYTIDAFYYTDDNWENRKSVFCDWIYDLIKDRDTFLFEFDSSKKPVLGTFLYPYCRKKKYNYYAYTELISLTKDDILDLFDDTKFYLGGIVIVLSTPDDDTISSLLTGWNTELVLSGVKMINMGYDGLFLRFYNMKDLLPRITDHI